MKDLVISSDKFVLDVQYEALRAMHKCLAELGQQFFVIGATARDLLAIALGIKQSEHKTRDLDICIAISSWDVFEDIKEHLIANGFTKDLVRKQRFYYGYFEIDVVPFGGISNDGEKIFWPPEESPEMTVRGFESVLRECVTVQVQDGGFYFKIPTSAGLFIMKLDAWLDRGLESTRDMEDLMYLMDNYYETHCLEEQYVQVYDIVEDADPFVCGAFMLGMDVNNILTKEELAFYIEKLNDQLSMEENSALLTQSVTFSKRDYQTVARAWTTFIKSIQTESSHAKL